MIRPSGYSNLAILNREGWIFERLLDLRNDVGLLSEEYDPESGRLVGNFPQAFSHLGLVNTAPNLTAAGGPAEDRQDAEEGAPSSMTE